MYFHICGRKILCHCWDLVRMILSSHFHFIWKVKKKLQPTFCITSPSINSITTSRLNSAHGMEITLVMVSNDLLMAADTNMPSVLTLRMSAVFKAILTMYFSTSFIVLLVSPKPPCAGSDRTSLEDAVCLHLWLQICSSTDLQSVVPLYGPHPHHTYSSCIITIPFSVHFPISKACIRPSFSISKNIAKL